MLGLCVYAVVFVVSNMFDAAQFLDSGQLPQPPELRNQFKRLYNPRSVTARIDFPEVGEINHTDLYYLVRNKFQLSSNRLENACRVILGQTNKTRIDSTNWLRALQGHPGAIAYILEHNEYDVLDLEDLYKSIIHYKRHTDNSI